MSESLVRLQPLSNLAKEQRERLREAYLEAENAGGLAVLAGLIVKHGQKDALGSVWIFRRDGINLKLRTYKGGQLEGYVTPDGGEEIAVLNDLVAGEERFIKGSGRWLAAINEESQYLDRKAESEARLAERVEIINIGRETGADI